MGAIDQERLVQSTLAKGRTGIRNLCISAGSGRGKNARLRRLRPTTTVTYPGLLEHFPEKADPVFRAPSIMHDEQPIVILPKALDWCDYPAITGARTKRLRISSERCER